MKRSNPPRSLKHIRRDAPPQDHDLPALRPFPTPEKPPCNDEALEQLERACGRYGKATVARVRWSAIYLWASGMMLSAPTPQLRNPRAAAWKAAFLVREADAYLLGYPNHTGEPFAYPALHEMTPKSRREAERMAAETAEDWEMAGRPGLTLTRIKEQQQYVQACVTYGTAASSTRHLFKESADA